MNYYAHHLGDYARDTGHLSLLEHGAYRVMLDHYYATERPLPADLDRLCRLCRAVTKAERQAVVVVAGEFFEREGDVLRHKRVDEELAKMQARVEASRGNGGKGGRPRKRTREEPDENPVGFGQETHQEPSRPHRARPRVRASTSQEVTPDLNDPEIPDSPQAPLNPAPAVSAAGAAAGGGAPDLWALGREILGAGLFGRCMREHGEPALGDAIAATIRKRPADAKPYLLGLLNGGGKRAANGPRGGVGERLSAADRVEANYRAAGGK